MNKTLPPLLRIVVLTGALFCLSSPPYLFGNNAAVTSAAPAQVVPNRTLPKFEPPQAGLRFSAQPTAQEFLRVRLFREALVPIGGEPGAGENQALAKALLEYSQRPNADDFSAVTGFLKKHPASPWNAALLTSLGFEFYHTAHYSKAIDAWSRAWQLAKDAKDNNGKAIADRAVGELAYMYGRIGRMSDLDVLLKSIEGRTIGGAGTEKISGIRQALWNMQNRPEISFRCGPLALQRIQESLGAEKSMSKIVFNSASTTNGFSLVQVAELSKKLGMNYQMAYRRKDSPIVVPSVIHWKLDHYAAIIRQKGDHFLIQDPTFKNDVWVTRAALEDEASGFFLIPSGNLPSGWRKVELSEGGNVWGKGLTGGNGPGPFGCQPSTGNQGCDNKGPDCKGMAVPSINLMMASLSLADQPLGYSPPVGPAMNLNLRYNQREYFQPGIFNFSNFGSKWACDWIRYMSFETFGPNPAVELAGSMFTGGGHSAYESDGKGGFKHHWNDQSKLSVTNSDWQITSPDGDKLVFGLSTTLGGGAATRVYQFLTERIDPFGNKIEYTYDADFRLVAITDAIGQVTTLHYELPSDFYKITKVTDPFGRVATFDYDSSGRLTKITDVIGLTSQFTYEAGGDFISALTTPYGTTSFSKSESGTTRSVDINYPNGDRERVEYNQTVPLFIPAETFLPQGMITINDHLQYRNTYWWDRIASATGYGDYTKAKVYHWVHSSDGASTAGVLESTKMPLENRVWYNYEGQGNASHFLGDNNRPTKIGRVLDDGSTQLTQFEYNAFGKVTKSIDPLGRTLSYTYSDDGIDLLEVRQTRASNNELLTRITYDQNHLPLTVTDAAGQTTTNTYNARGQLLTRSDPEGHLTSYTYDTNGYRIAVDGPLPGTNDTVHSTYDVQGRMFTKTDMNGYMVTIQRDAMDRLTNITFPDGTFSTKTYDRLDVGKVRDRAGRETLLEHDSMRQLAKRTDPLGRVTRFQWCSCGDISSMVDPMGRTTAWHKDVQGRLVAKEYGDGSRVNYLYENTTSRLRQVIDEKGQITQFTYNLDDSLRSQSYANTAVHTPSVSYEYDSNYRRVASMTDGIGTTHYSYLPITTPPMLGANKLAAVDGPLPNDTITYGYDSHGSVITTAIDGVASTLNYDEAGRMTASSNALGNFTYTYDGLSGRRVSQSFPNNLTLEHGYGDQLHDLALGRITYKFGTNPVSEFLYDRNIPADHRIDTWSQQVGLLTPDVHTFGYDAADQLISAVVTNSGVQIGAYSYAYDPAGNRLLEQINGTNIVATYNALNQLTSITNGSLSSRTNEWDGNNRLVASSEAGRRTEFAYDGNFKLASIRLLTNGVEASLRRFLWLGNSIAEERDASGVNVAKRYFKEGMKIESGPTAGNYYYTHDHLKSVRQLVDSTGAVRASYAFDPYGKRTKLSGDVDSDFGFAGMFWTTEARLNLTMFRLYDPEIGRWLSRDPLPKAEMSEGPNLYFYVGNDPGNSIDPLGLEKDPAECCKPLEDAYYKKMDSYERRCEASQEIGMLDCRAALMNKSLTPEARQALCVQAEKEAIERCDHFYEEGTALYRKWQECLMKADPCAEDCPPKCSGGLLGNFVGRLFGTCK